MNDPGREAGQGRAVFEGGEPQEGWVLKRAIAEEKGFW